MNVRSFFSSLLRMMPPPIKNIPREWTYYNIKNEIKRTALNKPEKKIFGIGLSRTGTTSLSHALDRLGYDTADWMENGKVVGWPEFYTRDAVTDIPCCLYFESLYFTFEKSKFIYTIRDEDEWKRSIERHYGLENPSYLRNEWTKKDYWEGNKDWKFHNSFKKLQIHKCLYASHESWTDAYRSYDERVRNFFENKPNDRILVMDIPNGDGWNKLCNFLNKDKPESPFPHDNQYKYP